MSKSINLESFFSILDCCLYWQHWVCTCVLGWKHADHIKTHIMTNFIKFAMSNIVRNWILLDWIKFFIFFSNFRGAIRTQSNICNIWNVCKYGVLSNPYFPVFGLNTKYLSVLSPNAGKYGPEKNSLFGQLSGGAAFAWLCWFFLKWCV